MGSKFCEGSNSICSAYHCTCRVTPDAWKAVNKYLLLGNQLPLNKYVKSLTPLSYSKASLCL